MQKYKKISRLFIYIHSIIQSPNYSVTQLPDDSIIVSLHHYLTMFDETNSK